MHSTSYWCPVLSRIYTQEKCWLVLENEAKLSATSNMSKWRRSATLQRHRLKCREWIFSWPNVHICNRGRGKPQVHENWYMRIRWTPKEQNVCLFGLKAVRCSDKHCNFEVPTEAFGTNLFVDSMMRWVTILLWNLDPVGRVEGTESLVLLFYVVLRFPVCDSTLF